MISFSPYHAIPEICALGEVIGPERGISWTGISLGGGGVEVCVGLAVGEGMGVMVAEGRGVKVGAVVAEGGRTTVGRMISSSIPKQPDKKIEQISQIERLKRNFKFI